MKQHSKVSPWKRLCLSFATWQMQRLMSWSNRRTYKSVLAYQPSMAHYTLLKQDTAAILRTLMREAKTLGVAENLRFALRATAAQCRKELTP